MINIKCNSILLTAALTIFVGLRLHAQRPPIKVDSITANDTKRSIAPFFAPATALKKNPDADGFIQRWLLLEPINKSIRSNLVFTDSYLKAEFETDYFPNQFTVIPKDGETVNVGEQQLRWHALESPDFNVKLFRFAYGLKKQTYAVLFWAVTVVNSPREMKNVKAPRYSC